MRFVHCDYSAFGEGTDNTYTTAVEFDLGGVDQDFTNRTR